MTAAVVVAVPETRSVVPVDVPSRLTESPEIVPGAQGSR